MNNIKNLFTLKNKIIIITGACGLLGQEHAKSIAAYGGTPILLDISKEKVESLASKLNTKYKTNSIGYVVDITNETEVEENSMEIVKRFGRIDGLVNNAANNPKMESDGEKNFSKLESFPMDIWIDDLAVGLTGSFLCSKYYGTIISQNPLGGSIVNISSDLGLVAPDQRLYKINGISGDMQSVKPITYSVVKSGIIGLTRYLSTY